MMYFYKTSNLHKVAFDKSLRNVLHIIGLILFTQLVACGGGSDNPNPGTDQPLPVQPKAVINVEQSYEVGDTVILDGSASVIPDGSSFNWSMEDTPSGTEIIINDDDTLTASFIPTDAGEYTAKLSIVDASMNETASAQQTIVVEPVDDPAGWTDVTLINTQDNPITFSDGCLGDGDVVLNDNGASVAVSFNQDLVAVESGGSRNRVCQVKFSLWLPDGMRIATSQSTVNGTEAGDTLASIVDSVAGTTLDATFRRYNDVEGNFQLASPVLSLEEDTSPCGGVVTLKTVINIAAYYGQISIAGGEPAALIVTNSYSACTVSD